MTTDPSWWTSVLLWLPAFSACVSAGALAMTVVNLGVYRRAAPRAAGRASAGEPGALPVVTVCIPARNEELNVEAAVRGALANADVPLEVLVYDDQSTDRTPAILAALRSEDPRVRAVATEPLPDGWNGKQWGCERMGQAARGQWLLFTDADVRFAPDCFARALAEAARLDASLLSTVPREETGTFLERLVVPMMILLGLMVVSLITHFWLTLAVLATLNLCLTPFSWYMRRKARAEETLRIANPAA